MSNLARKQLFPPRRNLNNAKVPKLGVKEYSPLYDLPRPFDIIFSLPLDEFHLAKEGLGKMFIRRLFEDSVTVDSRAIFKQWNASYQATSVVSEIPRCSRNVSTGQLKGSELSVLIHSTFPHLVELMQEGTLDFWYHIWQEKQLLPALSQVSNHT